MGKNQNQINRLLDSFFHCRSGNFLTINSLDDLQNIYELLKLFTNNQLKETHNNLIREIKNLNMSNVVNNLIHDLTWTQDDNLTKEEEKLLQDKLFHCTKKMAEIIRILPNLTRLHLGNNNFYDNEFLLLANAIEHRVGGNNKSQIIDINLQNIGSYPNNYLGLQSFLNSISQNHPERNLYVSEDVYKLLAQEREVSDSDSPLLEEDEIPLDESGYTADDEYEIRIQHRIPEPIGRLPKPHENRELNDENKILFKSLNPNLPKPDAYDADAEPESACRKKRVFPAATTDEDASESNRNSQSFAKSNSDPTLSSQHIKLFSPKLNLATNADINEQNAPDANTKTRRRKTI